MSYNKLTAEEEWVIAHKATELLSLVNMTIFMRMEHLSVEGVMPPLFHLKASLTLDVDGALMKAQNAVERVLILMG